MKERRKSICPLEEEHKMLVLAIYGNSETGEKGMIERQKEMRESLIKIETFMENMSGINDVATGLSLLKKPTLWILAIVVGIVALFGGLKTLFGWFFVMK